MTKQLYSQLRFGADKFAPFTVAGAKHLVEAKYLLTFTKARAISIIIFINRYFI